MFIYICAMSCEFTPVQYINSFKKTRERIEAIDLLIDSMMANMTLAIAGEGSITKMYEYDDGQVKVKTEYRSIDEIKVGIDQLEQLKQMYLNRLTGRVINLRDVRGLR